MKDKLCSGWDSFLDLCRGSASDRELDELLGLLLTLEEKQAITTRVLLTQALLKGDKTQREISEELGVSIAKITRGSNALKTAKEPIKQLINRSRGTDERHQK